MRESVQSLKQMCQHLEPCEEIFSRIKNNPGAPDSVFSVPADPVWKICGHYLFKYHFSPVLFVVSGIIFFTFKILDLISFQTWLLAPCAHRGYIALTLAFWASIEDCWAPWGSALARHTCDASLLGFRVSEVLLSPPGGIRVALLSELSMGCLA